MRYVKDKREIYDGFIKWMIESNASDSDIYHSRTFPKDLEKYEEDIKKLLPEFTKEDVVKCLGNSLTIYSVKRFYTRSKWWIQYCRKNHLYDIELSDDDLYNTFLYKVPLKDYKKDFEKLQKFFSKSEFIRMVETYLGFCSNYMVAMTMVLLWEGLTIDEITSIRLDECNGETGEYKVGETPHKLDNDYFVGIMDKAMAQTYYINPNGKRYSTLGTVYLIRSSSVANMNNPISYTSIANRFVATFFKLLDKEYCTAQDIQSSGKFWRMYMDECNGKNVRHYENGNELLWYTQQQYDQYKEYISNQIRKKY